ncbi:hypothetical protein Bca101_050462 [Brassica carinata]
MLTTRKDAVMRLQNVSSSVRRRGYKNGYSAKVKEHERTHPARIFPSSRHMPEPEASPSLIKAEEKKSSVRTRLGVKIAPFHNLRFIFVHRQQIQDLAKLSRDQVFSFVEMARLLEIKPSDLTRCSGGGGGFDIELLQTHENRWTQRLSRLLLARHLITKESTAITEEERSSSSSSLHGKHALNISKLRVDHGYNLRSEKGLFVLNSMNSSTTSHSSFLALHAADSHDSTTHLHKITSSHRRCFDHVKLGPRQRRFVKTISASRLTSTRLLLIKARDFIMGSFRLHMDHNNTAKRRPSTAIRLLRFFHGVKKGGLGIRKLWDSAKAFTMKLIWQIFTQSSSLRVSWVTHYLLKYNSFWDVRDDSKGSWIWSDAVNMEGWTIRGQRCRRFQELYRSILTITSPEPENGTDMVLWKHGDDDYLPTVSSARTWDQVRVKRDKVLWSKVVWLPQGIPRYDFITSLAIKNRLSTGNKMRQWGMVQGLENRDDVKPIANTRTPDGDFEDLEIAEQLRRLRNGSEHHGSSPERLLV